MGAVTNDETGFTVSETNPITDLITRVKKQTPINVKDIGSAFETLLDQMKDNANGIRVLSIVMDTLSHQKTDGIKSEEFNKEIQKVLQKKAFYALDPLDRKNRFGAGRN